MAEKTVKTVLRVIPCLILVALFSACYPMKTPLQGSGSGFVREEFLLSRRLVLLPFEGDETGEVSDAFSLSFQRKFPGMEIIERKRLKGLFEQEDLRLGQLSDDIRRRIGRELNAQAVIMGSVQYPSITKWILQIKIVDVQTGEILGRSLAEVDFMGALGVREGCELAVQNLRPR